MVARRARVRVAAREGLERHHRMPARCGHCSTRASDQMLRRIVPTAERTVSPGQRPKAIDKGAAIRERPRFARKFEFWWIGSFASICPAFWWPLQGGWPRWVPRRKLQPVGTVSFCRWTSRDVLRLGSIDRAIFSLSCKLRTLGWPLVARLSSRA
jgi:hypothetical protein